MRCDLCNKNEATIHIQEIINGEKKNLHLCGQCAAKKAQNVQGIDLGGFNLAEMLYNLSEKFNIPGLQLPGQVERQEQEHSQEQPDISCPVCGWSVVGLRRTGRLGCPECYNTFKSIIDGALENMHRGKLHVGKKPGADKSDESPRMMLEMMNLQKELEELVKREEYEKAAEVRDKISDLKKKITN
ncbi:MAG: UvrB/UvrC motif-containing protein [Victivallaceae bacterium]